MTDLHFNIRAIDSLMFRDGRPFNQNDAGASIANSVFPPYPPTLVGAIRAAMWAMRGGSWPTDGALGDGTNWQAEVSELGPLQFRAPILLKDDEPIFPVPSHIVWDRAKNLSRLKPGLKIECDLGEKYLPIADGKGIKSIDDHWVSQVGMAKILAGSVPAEADLIKTKNLWGKETRVGIGIDPESRIAADGDLYMASQVRMADDVALKVSSSGWGEKYIDFASALRPLGGEHRMAHISVSKNHDLPEVEFPDGAKKFCLIALSPVVPDPSGIVKGLPKGLVSACLGKPISIGGWNSQARRAIPLRQCYPAGSVWFFEKTAPSDIALATGASIGLSTEWGFGQVMIGKW